LWGLALGWLLPGPSLPPWLPLFVLLAAQGLSFSRRACGMVSFALPLAFIGLLALDPLVVL
jgi:hypothetical protein